LGYLAVATVDIGHSQFGVDHVFITNRARTISMSIVQDPEHSDGTPTVEGTGIRVKDVAVAYEHSGYEPDEITQLYPDLSLGDVHRALAYYYDHIDDFRSAESATA
jgi:uncharacterized protein (DUF433 family)